MIGAVFGKYIARNFLRNLLLTFGLFVALIVAVDLLEMSRDLSKVPDAGLFDALSITVLRAPAFAENILPFAVLFGAAACLLLLNARLELVVARASGVSVWQFLTPFLATALAVGLFGALVYNPLALLGQKKSLENEASVFGSVAGGFAKVSGRFWIRLDTADGDIVIRANVQQNGATILTALTLYEFDESGASVRRIDASRGEFVTGPLGQNYYKLLNARISEPSKKLRVENEMKIFVNVSREQLRNRATQPREVDFWSLNQHGERLREAGRNALPFDTQFQSLLAQPALFAAMVLIAATFSLKFARFGQNGKAVLAGILSGFVLYVVSRLTLTFGSNGLVSPHFAAWAPALVAILIAISVLLHQEDG